MKYYLSLGSNSGNRLLHLQTAYRFLQTQGTIGSTSSVYQTAPVGMGKAADFFNMCVEFDSLLTPKILLHAIKSYESSAGRDLSLALQPRPIDIDILFADDICIQTHELTIPHPRIPERAFVLIPLVEIAAQLIHPASHESVLAMLKRLNTHAKVDLIGPLFPDS
jgi:2-amino-4-hydroxy-6-hydroxymethyldihydropteridine diphosphokinase